MKLRVVLTHAAALFAVPVGVVLLAIFVPLLLGEPLPDWRVIRIIGLSWLLVTSTRWAVRRFTNWRKARRRRARQSILAVRDDAFSDSSDVPKLHATIKLIHPLSREAWLEAIPLVFPRSSLWSRIESLATWILLSLVLLYWMLVAPPKTPGTWIRFWFVAVLWLVFTLVFPVISFFEWRIVHQLRRKVRSPDWKPRAFLRGGIFNSGLAYISAAGRELHPWHEFESFDAYDNVLVLRGETPEQFKVVHRSQLEHASDWEIAIDFLSRRFAKRA